METLNNMMKLNSSTKNHNQMELNHNSSKSNCKKISQSHKKYPLPKSYKEILPK